MVRRGYTSISLNENPYLVPYCSKCLLKKILMMLKNVSATSLTKIVTFQSEEVV